MFLGWFPEQPVTSNCLIHFTPPPKRLNGKSMNITYLLLGDTYTVDTIMVVFQRVFFIAGPLQDSSRQDKGQMFLVRGGGLFVVHHSEIGATRKIQLNFQTS